MEHAGNRTQIIFSPAGFLKPHLKCDKCSVMENTTNVNTCAAQSIQKLEASAFTLFCLMVTHYFIKAFSLVKVVIGHS